MASSVVPARWEDPDRPDSRLAQLQRWLLAGLVFFVVLALYPFTPNPAGDLKILGYEVCSFAAFALWLFTPSSSPARGPSSALLPLLLTFVIVNLVAALNSVNRGYSFFQDGAKWVALFLLSVSAARAFGTPRRVGFLCAAIVLAVSITSVYGLAQHRGWDPFPWRDTTGMRSHGPATYGNPNLASHAIAPAIILACGLALRRRSRWAVLCIPVLLAHLAITRTRGSILGLAGAAFLVMVAIALARTPQNAARQIAKTAAAFLLVVGLALAGAGMASRYISGQPYPYDSGESIMLRYHSFYGACNMIRDRPWLGFGPGMYEVASPPYWTPLQKDRFSELRKVDDHVHCEPLELAVDSGIFSALLYISVFVLGVYYGLRLWFTRSETELRYVGLTLAAVLLEFLLDGFFGFNVHVPVSALLAFLLVGALAGLCRHAVENRATTQFRVSSLLWRLPALAAAAVIPTLGARVFAAQVMTQRGMDAMQFNAPAQAYEYFRKAEAYNPYSWIPPYYQGTLAAQKQAPEMAENRFSRTLALNPNYLVAQFSLAKTLFNLAGRPDGTVDAALLEKAVQAAQRAAQIDTRFNEVQELLGRTAYLRAQTTYSNDKTSPAAVTAWREAEQALSKAIALGSKEQARLYHLLASARLELGDAAGAQSAMVKAAQEKPDDPETWRLFYQVSQQSGQYHALIASLDKQIEYLVRSNKVPSDNLIALQSLHASALFAGYGDVPVAEAEFQRILAGSPQSLIVWSDYYAFAKASKGATAFTARLSETVRAHDKAGQPLPLAVRAAARGLDATEEGVAAGVTQLAQAVQQRQAAKNETGWGKEFSWAADILAGQARALAIAPERSGDIFLTLGLVYGACEEFGAAAAMLGHAEPGLSGQRLAQCLLHESEALTKIGRTDAAVKALEKAAAKFPGDFDVRYAYAKGLARARQYARARLEYGTILASFGLNEEGRRNVQAELDALPVQR